MSDDSNHKPDSDAANERSLRGATPLSRWIPSLPFLVPMAVYMIVGIVEPGPPKGEQAELRPDGSVEISTGEVGFMGMTYEDYPKVYTVKIGLVILSMLPFLPDYFRFPFRVSWLAILVGAVGVVVWIGISKLKLEPTIFGSIGMESFVKMGERPAFNPLEMLAATPDWAKGFLAIRFLGLALIVPIMEEFFLRAWLMRFVIQADWWKIPFAHVTLLALAVGIVFPALYHSAEFIAALVWFGMVTWLMLRTKNIWDCVAAHSVTNLLLGIYVVSYGDWQLW